MRRVKANRQLLIGIDVMGSDNSPDALVRAAISLIPSLSADIGLVVIGAPHIASLACAPLAFHPAEEAIAMGENPLSALRKKKHSSIAVGLRLLKAGKINAFVSAGNTGALVSASKMILGSFPGLIRPALLALMPTKKNPVAVLDVGATLQAKETHLVHFALLGAAYQQALGMKAPRVGILNIGSEALKGTSEIRLAYRRLELLQQQSFHFAGNIEGTSVFNGEVDVLVTDGFTGNIFLKTAEGIASLILDRLQANISQEMVREIRSQLNDLQKHLHYAEHPGALLAGVNETVVKCHGYSTPEAFGNGIRGAIELTTSQFTKTLKSQFVKNIG
ncbi:MAG: phosphate acyltransferase PlsX [Chlamydiia bacterium]|nr:phosphate acyltransferase PlsX [Chlamydiia bacterium]